MLVEVTEEEFELIKKILDEAEEPGYMNGEFSYWDRRRMAQGKPPVWAKSMKDVPARKKELRQSSAPSEIAMRSVTSEDGKAKKPYTESDWRRDKENATAMNQRIADAVADLLSKFEPFDHTDANQEYASIYVKAEDGQLDEYRIYGRMRGYMVKFIGHESVFSRKSEAVENINAVAIYIRNGGEI